MNCFIYIYILHEQNTKTKFEYISILSCKFELLILVGKCNIIIIIIG